MACGGKEGAGGPAWPGGSHIRCPGESWGPGPASMQAGQVEKNRWNSDTMDVESTKLCDGFEVSGGKGQSQDDS